MKKWPILLLILLTSCTTDYTINEDIYVNVYFCPQDNCAQELINAINNAQERVHCAFYDLKLPEVQNALFTSNKKVDTLLILDNDNSMNWEKNYWVRKDISTKLMHNKFCVIDYDYVWTGSFNPTTRGNTMNNNNALLIKSKSLNKNFEDEFKEMWYGTYNKGYNVKFPKIGYIENYFCPEDSCSQHVLETLSLANSSIKFMTFSFTDDAIGDLLLQKHEQNILIQGVFETTQNNAYTEYEKLVQANVNVKWDSNPANMHHKVFIVDDSIVITGSYNPTGNGDKYNDENIIIIHNKEIAKKYVDEFEKIFGQNIF